MAAEQLLRTFTLLTGTTGIAQHRFVAISAGKIVWPSSGGIDAVAVTVSTASSGTTEDNRAATVAFFGSVVKVATTYTTMSVGDIVSCTTRGQALVAGTTNYRQLGTVIGGSSGAAGRLLTVSFNMVGST